MRRHGGVPYYEYHGKETYYGIPIRSTVQRSSFMSKRPKKSLTEKLSDKLDKLGNQKSKDKDRSYNRAYHEVYRDHYGNILLPRIQGGNSGSPAEAWNHRLQPSSGGGGLNNASSSSPPVPRRHFQNVLPRKPPGIGGRSNSTSAAYWDPAYSPTRQPVGGEHLLYGEMIPGEFGERLIGGEFVERLGGVSGGEYHNFAINSNVCLCEDNVAGSSRGKKSGKQCKKCGFNRPGSETYRNNLRRSLSEESLGGQMDRGAPSRSQDPYSYMRKRRVVYPKPVFYDEQDEYEDIMYDMSHLPSESGGGHHYHRENRTEVIHDDDDFSNSGFHRKICVFDGGNIMMTNSTTSPVRSQSNRTSPLRPVVHHHSPAGYHQHHNNRNISRNHSSPHSIVPQHVVSSGAGLSSPRRVTPSRRNSTNGNMDVGNNSYNKNIVVSNPSLTSPRTSPNRNIVTVNGKNNSSIIYLTAAASPLANDGSGRDSSASTTNRRQRRSNSQEVTKKNHSITISNMAGGGADSESGGSGGNYSVKSFATSTPVKGAATLSPSLSQSEQPYHPLIEDVDDQYVDPDTLHTRATVDTLHTRGGVVDNTATRSRRRGGVTKYSRSNSLSDSNLSSDGVPILQEDNFSKSESDLTDLDSDADGSSTGGRPSAARYNSFKISGQKIQIYSDCSVRRGSNNSSAGTREEGELSDSSRDNHEQDNIYSDKSDKNNDDDVYSTCESNNDDRDNDICENNDSDIDSNYSYDADCSVVESPRFSGYPRVPEPVLPPQRPKSPSPPQKPPRRKSSCEKEIRRSVSMRYDILSSNVIVGEDNSTTIKTGTDDNTSNTVIVKTGSHQNDATGDKGPKRKSPARTKSSAAASSIASKGVTVVPLSREDKLSPRVFLPNQIKLTNSSQVVGSRNAGTLDVKIRGLTTGGIAMRSQSFSDSRDSLLGSCSDFRHHAISKDFSNEIITELYGSKTSLLEELLRRKSSAESDSNKSGDDLKIPKDKPIDNAIKITKGDNKEVTAVEDDPFSPMASLQDESEDFQPISRQKLVERWQNDAETNGVAGTKSSNRDDNLENNKQVSREKILSAAAADFFSSLETNPPSLLPEDHRALLTLRDSSGNHRPFFQDTTRLRQISRPSLKDAFNNGPGGAENGGDNIFVGATGAKLGRLGMSHSFRERLSSPPRPPLEPPPLPPSLMPGGLQSNPAGPPSETSTRSLTKRIFSFNKSELKKINKLLGIGKSDAKKDDNHSENIYDIAQEPEDVKKVKIVDNSRFYSQDVVVTPLTASTVSLTGSEATSGYNNGYPDLKLKTSNGQEASGSGGWKDYVKPSSSANGGGKPKRSRSKSFTPRTRSLHKSFLFNRSLGQIPKLGGGNSNVHRSESCRKFSFYGGGSNASGSSVQINAGGHSTNSSETDISKPRTLSSSDLVTIFPEEEEIHRGFKDIRKILSSPSISVGSGGSQTGGNGGIYRPKSQLSSSSSVINAIKEEQLDSLPGTRTTAAREMSCEHIYEEINNQDLNSGPLATSSRPLPPLPGSSSGQQLSTSSSQPPQQSPTSTSSRVQQHSPSNSSTRTTSYPHRRITPPTTTTGIVSRRTTPTGGSTSVTSSSENSSPQKSIFEGATKYDILNYLEDARERGLTDCDLDDLSDDQDVDAIDPDPPEPLVIGTHKLSNTGSLTSRSSTTSTSSSSSGSSSCEDQLPTAHTSKQLSGGSCDKQGSSVDIERNDSGLGSERGVGRREGGKILIRKRTSELTDLDTLCIDCDQTIETNSESRLDDSLSVCDGCANRRSERKEIITEIIETEMKYGRDLRIIVDQFYRPMQIAGLLAVDQLANVFLNVEELVQVNERFTENLRDAIEIALDQGDEDLSTVSIGKLFIQASYMLGAFKSYCTRQGSASALLGSLEREKELLRIFLRVSQMENTMLRRMNLSSFLMVPVQRVTRYPLLLSRLLTVTPGHHTDRQHLQLARETIESSLETMNQETTRENSSTKLWRRISMMNAPARRPEQPMDMLGSTTWGVRKMVLECLGWSKEPREDINFVLEGRLLYTMPTDTNWRSLFLTKMVPVNVILVTLGSNKEDLQISEPTSSSELPPWNQPSPIFQPQGQARCREAALILLKEKGLRYTVVREPLMLDKCVVCWEQDWQDCFEVTEFTTKESFILKGEDVRQTSHWFQAIQHYCLALGQWRRRRNGLANIMINGMVRTHHQETQSTMVRSHSMETTSMMRNSSHHLNVAETISLSASVSTITEMSASNSPFLTS